MNNDQPKPTYTAAQISAAKAILEFVDTLGPEPPNELQKLLDVINQAQSLVQNAINSGLGSVEQLDEIVHPKVKGL